MKKTVGILGGMGPMATCDLMKRIIEFTEATCDQEHIHIIVDNNTNIPDRTAAIVSGGMDPRPEMIKSAKLLENAGADVIIVPCNTAHFFIDDVAKNVNIPFLHMPRETAKTLKVMGIKKVAVLATDGTIKSGLYEKELENMGITPVCPEKEDQKLIMSLIYDYVKAGKEYPDPEELTALIERLAKEGCEGAILGCTELPIAFENIKMPIPAVSPTDILAKAAVRFASNI